MQGAEGFLGEHIQSAGDLILVCVLPYFVAALATLPIPEDHGARPYVAALAFAFLGASVIGMAFITLWESAFTSSRMGEAVPEEARNDE